MDKVYNYEMLFMVNPVATPKDLEKMLATIKGVLTKHGAEVQKLDKWGDRKLAYKIRQHKRATYILGFFTAPPANIDAMKKDFQLVTTIIRSLVLAVEADAVNKPVPSANIE